MKKLNERGALTEFSKGTLSIFIGFSAFYVFYIQPTKRGPMFRHKFETMTGPQSIRHGQGSSQYFLLITLYLVYIPRRV